MASWSLMSGTLPFAPANPKELFNLQHTTLRNAVERTFGAWKKRFPILTHALDYNLGTQQDLVFALAVITTFQSITPGHWAIIFDWDESTQSTGEDAGNEEPPEDQPVQISCRQKRAACQMA
ncbi:hypothetical protein PSHT_08132 [Puccinia striiformis]|uniref:DDE Tnp4 domain-containing protein n=1 Tax=Puccinia striiformis TaxID=27350 RepID=A0A2S4VS71_9BASI|nr:hypothetical protein PSHT_08132 [Puccinia striiformis]